MPGTVTLFMGTYQSGHGTVAAEGSIQIGATIVAFGNLVNAKPAGLVDGTNNFFASGGTGNFNSAINTTGNAEVFWQSATFTGLSAGAQAYTISGMNSVNWADDNSGDSNWSGTLTIPTSSVAGVPEPGTVAMLGMGILLVGLRARRKAA